MMMLYGVRMKSLRNDTRYYKFNTRIGIPHCYRFDQERDDTEKIKKWVVEAKSDNKIIIDYILKGK